MKQMLSMVQLAWRRFEHAVAASRRRVARRLVQHVELRRFAKTRNVGVVAPMRVPPPGVVGSRDLGDIVVAQFTVDAVNHSTEFAGINEQGFAAPVAKR